MGRLTNTALALGTLTVIAAAPSAERHATVAVISTDRVRSLVVLPGERVTLEVVNRDSGSSYMARPQAGLLIPVSPGRWNWTAPPEPGLYPIQLVALDKGDSVTLQAFVVVPFDRLQGELLNGYRIGRYPAKPPAGFVEVTKENEDVFVSPHFRLKQFLCKQPAGSRKYVVLNERLLLALEYILERVNAAGYRATSFHVMSGYRTPAYNRSLANVRNSQHQWGAAADIFIDENGDGVMDDLTGDGRSDIRDAELLYRLIDGAAARPEAQGLIGGLGKYPPTAAHGPFVHVDVRDRKARW
jgi:hypothetical protein